LTSGWASKGTRYQIDSTRLLRLLAPYAGRLSPGDARPQRRAELLRDGLRPPWTRGPAQLSLDQETGPIWAPRHSRICH